MLGFDGAYPITYPIDKFLAFFGKKLQKTTVKH